MGEPVEIGYGEDDVHHWGFARIYEKGGMYALCRDYGCSCSSERLNSDYMEELVFDRSSLADLIPEAEKDQAVAEALLRAIQVSNDRALAALARSLASELKKNGITVSWPSLAT